MKEIVFVITDITGFGGTERTTCNLASTFAENGHPVTILSLFKENAVIQFEISTKVVVEYLSLKPYTLTLGLIERCRRILSVQKKLSRILAAKSYCQIISQAFLPSFLVWLTGNAKRTIVCEHFKYKLYNRLVCQFRDRIYSVFQCLVILNSENKYLYARHIRRIEIIPNMVLMDNRRCELNSKKIIAAGRLSSQKGFDLLIKAAVKVKAAYPNWSINIYGSGEMLGYLRSLISSAQLEDYVFLKGFERDIKSKLNQSSIFVLSSRHEGLPMVMLEAMAMGLAIVSFDCPTGPRTLLSNGGGLLVEPENIEALSDALIRVIENAELRKQLSEASLKKAMEYSPEIVYQMWLKII